MNYEVFQFQKSFEDRYKEYSRIFAEVKSYKSCTEIKDIWIDYLEKYVENCNWTAIWSVSRKLSYELHMAFSRMVYVTVNNVFFDSLTADVSILSLESNKKCNELPKKLINVPLKDLYIPKNQQLENIDIYTIADCLDKLRVFYNYLWWPWDEELTYEPSYWILNHLVIRLELYYDILQGNLHEITIKNITALIEKGRNIYSKIQNLPQLSEEESLVNSNNLMNTMDLYNELEIIKKKLQRWENTDMRKLLNYDIQKRRHNPFVHVIFPNMCSLKETIQNFDEASKLQPLGVCKLPTTNLKKVLSEYGADDTILVSTGLHIVNSERLDFNICIKSLYEENRSVLSEDSTHWYLFKNTADSITLQNININLKMCHAGIIVKEGITYLDKITFKTENNQSTNAVVIEDKGTLVASRCQFMNFNVAILCFPGSAVQLTDCEFNNNAVSVEIIHGAQLCLNNCDISQSKKIPIRYYGNLYSEEFKSLDFLSCFENVSIHSVKVKDSEKAVEFIKLMEK